MADVLDNMQERMAFLDEIQAQALLSSAKKSGHESARECACGNPIPEKRRSALPGVSTCVDCQTALEKGMKCMGFYHARRLVGVNGGAER